MLNNISILILIMLLTGCSPTGPAATPDYEIQSQLRLIQQSYTDPELPADLAEFGTVQPGGKFTTASHANRKTINLHKLYLNGHRSGWNKAFDDWMSKSEFRTDRELALEFARLGARLDGQRAGFKSAKSKIEEYLTSYCEH